MGFDQESAKGHTPTGPPVRAAQYVRMSTEHQRYSTENQGEAIAAYAARRGYVIVRTYADQGKSGLSLDGRDALKALIRDVRSGAADYQAVLVYDVSRWGRFQDTDESAYYEFVCREAGIAIHYCAEQFDNDGSLSATIIKSMKRAMAGEYSRELSAKVFAGQCRLIALGYRQGGPAGFGLRRCLVSEAREVKGQLARGEQKSLQTDRVILVPGPAVEVDTVRRIYRLFVDERRSEREIAALLNHEGVLTDLGRPWTRGTIHQLLINEKYAGHNVYNRTSFKLKQRRVANDPAQWIRADRAFEPIVAADIFEAARALIEARSRKLTDEDMLGLLRDLLGRQGALSGLVIDEVEDMPSSASYRHRFGSLVRAYQLIGYTPDRDFRYVETNRVLRLLHPEIVAGVVAALGQAGARVTRDPASDLLTLNGEVTASVVIARCRQTRSGSDRWKIRLDTALRPDITVAVRMDADNRRVQDYYLLPWIDLGPAGRLRMAADNGVFLDAYRTETLDPFYALARRTPIRGAA